jgi:hypothetical protein
MKATDAITSKIMAIFRYIKYYIDKLIDLVKEKPALSVSFCMAFVGLFQARDKSQMIGPLITLISIIMETSAPTVNDIYGAVKTIRPQKPYYYEDELTEVKGFFETLKGFFSSLMFSTETQAFGDGFTACYKTVIKAFANFFGMVRIPSIIHNMMPHIKNFNLLFTAGRGVSTIITNIFSYLPEFIGNLFVAHDAKLWFKRELTIPTSPVTIAASCAIAISIATAREEKEIVISLQADYARLRTLAMERVNTEGYALDTETTRIFKSLDTFANVISHNTKRNSAPFSIYIHGEAGCGKSTIWPVLASGLFPVEKEGAKRFSSTDEIREMTYARMAGTEY